MMKKNIFEYRIMNIEQGMSKCGGFPSIFLFVSGLSGLSKGGF